MHVFRLIALLVIAAMVIGLQDASAFSVDTKADTNSDGSARFTDPEDKAMERFGLSDNPSSAQSGMNATPLVNANASMPQPGMNAPLIQQKYR